MASTVQQGPTTDHPPAYSPGVEAPKVIMVDGQQSGSVQVVGADGATYVVQPQQVVGADGATYVMQPQQVVVAVGSCPACRSGFLSSEFTCCGICLGICFFPFGLLCCYAMRERRCNNCNAVYK